MSTICIALLLLAAKHCAAVDVEALTRGVNPEEFERYSPEKSPLFTCRDDSKQIPWDMVNDDFCDCKDGSDESGTSACNNGFFFCRNNQYKSKIITSSFVNDGVCDCCDGSDEHDGRTVCPNTCNEEFERIKKKMVEEYEIQLQGLEVRSTIVAASTKMVQEKSERLAVAKAELAAENEPLGALKEERDRLEGLVSAENAVRAEQAAQRKAVYDAALEAKKSEEAQRQRESGVAEEAIDTSAVFVEQPPEPETVPSDDENLLATVKAKIEPIQRKIESLEKEIADIEHFLGLDFGNNQEWASLHQNCFKNFVKDYNYEVCLFQKTAQGYTDTGKFDGWKDDRTKHFYANGQRCWQGPNRQSTVTFSCGVTHEIIAVSEPETCKYEMTLLSPMACSSEQAAFLKMEIDRA